MRDKIADILVWNPCTGQERWIPSDPYESGDTYGFSLGTCQDDKSGNTRYKVLSYRGYHDNLRFAIYDINSNKWNILAVDLKCNLNWFPVLLKGKTYWLAWDKRKGRNHIFVVSFDYTTERFERLLLPFERSNYRYTNVALDSVREEKLSVLLKRYDTSVQEMWVTNKIDETKVITWSKFLKVDCSEYMGWMVDEEKKKFLKCSAGIGRVHRNTNKTILAYTVGEENEGAQVDILEYGMVLLSPVFLNYVPSLVQIE